MEEKRVYEYIPVEEIKPEGQFLKAVCFKPKRAIYSCLIIGAALMFINNLYARLLGVVFILMSFIVLKLVSDHKVIDIFDKGVMIYGDNENRTACFISYDDIVEWNIRHEDGHDMICFDLKDGSKIIKDSFEVDSAFKTLYGLMKEKESNYIRTQIDKETPLRLSDALANIRRFFLKK
ncbi:MAG: hypothetical protein IJI66_15335 [Erysipelotrichaceae bacterium]|nr:hypothetical protein [Erysipelotrichaceae bacterium]